MNGLWERGAHEFKSFLYSKNAENIYKYILLDKNVLDSLKSRNFPKR